MRETTRQIIDAEGLQLRSERLAEAEVERRTLMDQKARSAKRYNFEIQRLDMEIEQLAREVDSGVEEVDAQISIPGSAPERDPPPRRASGVRA